MSYFEEQLIVHASPVISGLKASNMFSIPIKLACSVRDDFCTYCKLLSAKGLKMRFLYALADKVHVFVYNAKLIKEIISDSNVKAFLLKCGYPPESSITDMINFLKVRINENKGFPHEIGFFFGYPKDDVFEFIVNEGKNYKFCGCWKVYTNESKAVELFNSYKKIRDSYLNLAKAGVPVKSIISAA